MNDIISSGITPGTMISGRYKIISALGQGAMGDVYLCSHKDLQDKLFVLKVLKPEISNDETIMKRFHNEVIAALNVSHENVVRAYEFIKEGSLVGYTMEYVRGGDLADKMMINSQLPIELIINYLYQMCAGTGALHKHGIIHRDLKPENILITEDNIVKISDFGISMMDKNSRMTETGALLGSTNYIAPEYIQYQKVDERTDIYALGIIAYEMVTGTDPFPGDNIFIKMQQRTQVNPYDPRMYRNDCPEKLALWINKSITISPKDRFQTCAEMADALDEVNANDIGTFSKNPTHLDIRNRDTYELKDSVNEAVGGNRPKHFAQNYKSEVIDLTSTRQKSQYSPYVTTTIARKTKKNHLASLLYIFPIVALSIFGYLIYEKYQANKRPVVITPVVLPQQLVTVPKKNLPNEIVIFKDVESVFIDATLNFNQGKIQNLTFTASPPITTNPDAQLRRVSLTKTLLTQENGPEFTILGEANAEISIGDKTVTQKTSIRITGRRNNDNSSLKLNFIVPDKFDTNSLNNSYGVQRANKLLTPYLFGSFVVDAEELDLSEDLEKDLELN